MFLLVYTGHYLNGGEELSLVRFRFGTKEFGRGFSGLYSGVGFYSKKIFRELLYRLPRGYHTSEGVTFFVIRVTQVDIHTRTVRTRPPETVLFVVSFFIFTLFFFGFPMVRDRQTVTRSVGL